MANKDHVKRLNKIVDGLNDFTGWNRWRKANPKLVPDLSEATLDEIDLISDTDLSYADLTGASLFEASIESVNLRRANLDGADLRFAQLQDVDLRYAVLDHVDLTGANLHGADLRGVSLKDARLERTVLKDARLDSAVIGFTIFANCDLADARALDKVRHEGPSTIGIDTIFRSAGRIPSEFLKRAGVPDIILEFLPSLTAMGAIQFYSCFISYSSKDQDFVDRLYADLHSKGVRCWCATHDIQGGKKLYDQIGEAILRYDRVLLVLSGSSIDSNWVKAEIQNARRREITENKRVLFPIRLMPFESLRNWTLFDSDQGEDLARLIREFYIQDFTKWKRHNCYRREFDKLLAALRSETLKPAPL